MHRRRFIALAVPLLLVAVLVSSCKASSTARSGQASSSSAAAVAPASGAPGSSSDGCPTSNTTSFAKTKFVLHSGLAFGAFHRYVYKPYRAGTFSSGAHGRIKAFVKAGLAALFVKREVRLAYQDAKANPTLCKVIAAPLQAVGDKISAAVTAVKGGDAPGITGVEQSVQDAESKAKSNGTQIVEDPNAPLY